MTGGVIDLIHGRHTSEGRNRSSGFIVEYGQGWESGTCVEQTGHDGIHGNLGMPEPCAVIRDVQENQIEHVSIRGITADEFTFMHNAIIMRISSGPRLAIFYLHMCTHASDLFIVCVCVCV